MLLSYPNLKNTKGWLIGNFYNAVAKESFEVGIKEMRPGEINPAHYHEHCVEYTYVLKGKGILFWTEPNGVGYELLIMEGAFIKINPNEKYGFKIPEKQAYNTILLVVKNNSVIGDKKE
jgi:quercetin dioxygenase-like cupin family protein